MRAPNPLYLKAMYYSFTGYYTQLATFWGAIIVYKFNAITLQGITQYLLLDYSDLPLKNPTFFKTIVYITKYVYDKNFTSKHVHQRFILLKESINYSYIHLKHDKQT